MRRLSLLALPLLVPLASACGPGEEHVSGGVSMLGFGSIILFMVIAALGLFIAVMIKMLVKGGKG